MGRFTSIRARGAVGGIAIALALGVAACGESEDGDQAAQADGAPASQAAKDGLAKAAKRLAPLEQAPEGIGVTEPLSKLPTGKSVVWMQCAPAKCVTLSDLMAVQAEKLGMEYKAIEMGATPEGITKAWNTVVQERPDVVIATPANEALYSKQMAQAVANGTKVIANGVEQCDRVRNPCADGVETDVLWNVFGTTDFAFHGARQADYITVESEGKANVVYLHVPSLTVMKPEKDAFERELAEVCADCEVEVLEVDIADVGKRLPANVVSHLQANPDTDWVALAFGDMAVGVPEAIRAASLGRDVKLTTQAGSKLNFNYIVDGQTQVADFGVSTPMEAIRTIDAAARAAVGDDLDVAKESLPRQLLTKDSITFDPNQEWVPVEDYERQFHELWGIG